MRRIPTLICAGLESAAENCSLQGNNDMTRDTRRGFQLLRKFIQKKR